MNSSKLKQTIIKLLLNSFLVNKSSVVTIIRSPYSLADTRDGSIFRGRAGTNGGKLCSNSPDPPLFEPHFLLTLSPYPPFYNKAP